MQHFDLKVYLLTIIALVSPMAQVETFLRFALLILSIVYTIYKIYDRFQEKKSNKKYGEDDRVL